jgi:hypothetical protein
VKRFIQNELDENGVYYVPNRLVVTKRNTAAVRSIKEPGKVNSERLVVEAAVSSEYVIYSLQAQLAADFRKQMFSSMAMAVQMGRPALEACKKFLALYGIEPGEYDWASAYRTWERKKEEYLRPQEVVRIRKRKTAPVLQSRQLSIFT